MSSISPSSAQLSHPGLDTSRTQVAFDQAQQGVTQDPSLDLMGVSLPGTQAADTDAGAHILMAEAWPDHGPRQFADDTDTSARFAGMSLVEATAQAPETISEPLDHPLAAAA